MRGVHLQILPGGSGPAVGGVAVGSGGLRGGREQALEWTGGDEAAGTQGTPACILAWVCRRCAGSSARVCVPEGCQGEAVSGGAGAVSTAGVVVAGSCWDTVALGMGLRSRGLLVGASHHCSASSLSPSAWGERKPRAAGFKSTSDTD